jgi:hypothetical protein
LFQNGIRAKPVTNRARESLICAPVLNWEDPFKLDGYCVQHLYQTNLGLQIHLTVHSGDISKHLQKKRFHAFTGPIPEAGFPAPKSGFRGITLHRSWNESHWKVNKNKENLVGATRFGMVTNLH